MVRKILRDEKGRFLVGHENNYNYPNGYNKDSWFKKGHIGIKNRGRTGGGPNKTSFKKGNIAWNKGKSMIHSGSFKKYEEHPNWKGGIGNFPYPIEFNKELKEKIRERDNYICQECNQRGLSVHHIDYDKQNNNPFNLIVLCSHCHAKTNFNREHWKRCFQMKIFIKELFNPQNILIFNKNKLINISNGNL